MICHECQKLEGKISACSNYDPRRPRAIQNLLFHDQYANELITYCSAKQIKCRRKLIEKPSDTPDIYLATDALGSYGLKFIPHKPFTSGEDREKSKFFLSVNNEFTMAHEHGTYVNASLTGLETCGANVTLDSLYKTLYMVAVDKSYHRFNNVYIQMDNTVKSNKNWTVVQGIIINISCQQ